MPAMTMLHEKDPRADLLEKIGSLEDVEVFNAQVLIAIYVVPEKTKSGLILAAETRDENKYQGKVGLVVKMGPLAFKDDPARGLEFPIKVKVGDWVAIRTSDGFPLGILVDGTKTDCRLVGDTDIKLKIVHPDTVF